MGGKYSFSTAALFPRGAAESLRLLRSAGFEHAELMPQCFAEAKEDFAREAGGCGIHVASIHYPLAMFSMLYNAGEGMVEEARRFGEGLVRLGRALGSEVLVVHPHDAPKDRALAPLLEEPIRRNLQLLGEACAAAGMRLAVENSPKGPGRTPAGLLDYIAALAAGPAAGPMVDTTEAVEADEDPAAFIRAVKPIHTHLSDHAGEAKHIPAGEGEVDWKAVREALGEYSGYYTLEPLYRFYIDDPLPKLERALAFISGLVEGRD